jgi:two-component system, sensor histidine kinase and response regulator
MTLRTTGIVLSVLPLALTLLLAVPEVIVQIDTSQTVARAGHAAYLSELARDVEEAALDVGSSARGIVPGNVTSADRYARNVATLHAKVARLEGTVGTVAGHNAARDVSQSVTAYLRAVDANVKSAERSPLHALQGALNSGAVADRVRRNASIFADAAHDDELDALAALDLQRKLSHVFLAIAILGLMLCTLLLLHYSGRAVNAILELARKAERYRRGEPLGELVPRHDEIGELHRSIHEFVAAEREREQLLERYRLLAEVTQDIILFVDRVDLTVIDANAAAIKAYGYPDLIGRKTASLHAVEDPIDSETMASSDRPEGLSYEGSHLRADGSVFPVEVHARTAEVNGRLTIVKTIRDISERRQAAEQISLVLQRYHLLANTTSDSIVFIDRADLVIVEANAAALATYGYERTGFIGLPIARLHPPEEPYSAERIALADTPAGFSGEILQQRSDGTTFPAEIHLRTADVEGRQMIVATLHDISERRHAAEHIALALDHAIEASRLKSEFVATMSHEIRTPMHGVIGMSELLLETQLMPVQREYAVTVNESAQALLAIIDDILDFSKLEANKIELEAVVFDPGQIVSSAVNLARGTARDKGLTLRAYTSTHVPAVVRGDPTRLRQVLINLIGNAVKFTASGEVSVSTSVDRDDEHTVVLSFAVVDTGIGVRPEARERLFQAFVQGDGSTTRRFGGTGLGLSISRRLVELMGGRIWLGEHEGPGATFCFTARFERTSEIVAPVALNAGGLHVLVLDDDAAARRVFEATLVGWGMQNASAGDIESARTQLREAARAGAPFDVVLVDYVLPRSDGLAFAAELGERVDYGSPARILVTAFDAAGRKEAALAAGCSAYLVKPVDPSELFDALGRIGRAHKSRASAHGSGLRHARILMAEDSALIRRVAGFQLEELEYAVDIVENGTQAVKAVATGEFELVLMDLRMPEMDGLAATRAIRKAERTTGRHIVVIALTANVLDGDREACIEAGMDDFLTKPLKLDALKTALERWLPEPV